MHIREYNEKDFPSVLQIYAKSKLDELRFEQRVFKLLPLESDEKRLSALKESKIYVLMMERFLVMGQYSSPRSERYLCALVQEERELENKF